MRLEFTQASRRHKIGRARARQVLADPIAVVTLHEAAQVPTRVLFVGDDATGRALEVIVVMEGEAMVVIHAMDLRAKYRKLYEQGSQS